MISSNRNRLSLITTWAFTFLYSSAVLKNPIEGFTAFPWWRHQMKHFPRHWPSQMPVTRSFDVYFDLRLNKRLSKPSRRRLFETPSRSLWRHCSALRICGVMKRAEFPNHIPCFNDYAMLRCITTHDFPKHFHVKQSYLSSTLDRHIQYT